MSELQSKRWTRRTMLRAAPLAAGPALAGCAWGAAGQGGGLRGDAAPPAQLKRGATIVWAVDDGATRTPLRQDQTKLFKQQFPDINVDYVTGATDVETLVTLFAAGTPPDLLRQDPRGMALFASRGEIVPLDPYVKRDKYDLTDFFPATWGNFLWKGKHYGIPHEGGGSRIVYYNRALVQQAGLRPLPATWKDSSWTWEAFLQNCQKVTVRQGDSTTRWGFHVDGQRAHWKVWVAFNGGDVVSPDGSKVLLTEPPAVEALQFLQDLIYRYRVSPTPDEVKAGGNQAGLFQGGNLLVYQAAASNIAANRRSIGFDWSLTAIPGGKAKTLVLPGGGVGWYLHNASKVKDETWELMKALVSKESVRIQAQRGESTPSRRSVATEPAYSNPPESPGADMKVLVESLELTRGEVPLAVGQQIDDILDAEFAPLWLGQKTARDVTSSAAARIKPLLTLAG